MRSGPGGEDAAGRLPVVPAPHRAARALAAHGLRGSRLFWPLADRLAPRPSAPLARVGSSVVPTDRGDWTADALYRGTYERAETALVRRLVRRGGTAVDVGANLGHFTLLLAELVGPTGAVHAFEPSPRCAGVLRAALSATRQHWVVLHEVALGDAPGPGQLHDPGGAGHSGLASLRAGAGGPATTVRVQTLDAAAGALPPGEVDLLKLDTEGFEAQVLAGGAALLAGGRLRHVLLEVSPEFGDTGYAADLVGGTADRYDAYAVGETGRLRARPALLPLGPADVRRRTRQFNLLLRRRDGGADLRSLTAR